MYNFELTLKYAHIQIEDLYCCCTFRDGILWVAFSGAAFAANIANLVYCTSVTT